MVVSTRVSVVVLSYLGVSCMPAHLKKYQRPSEPVAAQTTAADMPTTELINKSSDTTATNDPLSQPIETEAPTNDAPLLPATAGQPSSAAPATIVATSDNTFRLALNDELVWNALIDILMKNYNLTLVDRINGLITTEWDSYYLDSTLYRNKMSIRLTRNGRLGCEMSIHNNVELASDQPALQGVWLPAPNNNEETNRVIRNVALMLRQPEPLLNVSNIARSIPGSGVSPQSR